MESVTMKAKYVPVQVTIIKLTKENYLHWVVAIKMSIASRGRIKYINGRKNLPSEEPL